MKFSSVRLSSGPFMSNRALAHMLIVSSNVTAVNRLFISKERIRLWLNVLSFAKFTNVNESFTQNSEYLSETDCNSRVRYCESLCYA